jgi:hypothetical protein
MQGIESPLDVTSVVSPTGVVSPTREATMMLASKFFEDYNASRSLSELRRAQALGSSYSEFWFKCDNIRPGI